MSGVTLTVKLLLPAGRNFDTRIYSFDETGKSADDIKSGTAAAVALGFFDGVHLGHAAVIKAAADQGLQTAVVTFSSNPGKTENGHPVPEITCPALKENILESLGADAVVYLDFNKVRDMEPNGFLDMLTAMFNIKYITSGFNYRFGRGAAAGVRELKTFCKPRGIEVCSVAPVCVSGLPISSTRIRMMIMDGNVKEASGLLGRPFAVYGEVVHGHQLGRTLGTPTINQLLPPPQLLPRFGVYATLAHVGGKKWPAVTNVGVKPTISDSEAVGAETYILGFEGDLYGKIIQVDFIEFVRPERKFDGLEKLRAQMKCDAETAYKITNSIIY